MTFQIDEGKIINLKGSNKLSIENLNEILVKVRKNNKYGDIIWCDDLPNDSQSKKLIQEIETQLRYNNENFTRYPSDYLHALFSYIVYKDLNVNDKLDKLEIDLDEEKYIKELDGWEVSKVYCRPTEDEGSVKKGSIFYAALFINTYKNQMILTHRGIDADWLSWFQKESPVVTHLSGTLLNESVPQMLYCYETLCDVVEKYAKTKEYEDFHLSFTGYSNGAWLAEYSIYYSHHHLEYKKCQAVLFESPGFFKDEQELSSNIVSPESDIYLGNMKIINYLTAPNLINSCNKHVGIVYRIFLEDNEENSKKFHEFINKYFNSFKKLSDKIKDKLKKSKFLTEGLMNMFNHENLKKIIKQFRKDTGKPEYYEQMLNWPLAGIDFDKNYQENIKKCLIETPVNKIVDNIPLAKFLPEILLDGAKTFLTFVGSATVDKTAQYIAPGLYVFLNIFIEICKGNMDLDQFENELFYERLDKLNEITASEDYIDYSYNPEQDEQVKDNIFKRIFKKIKPKTKEEKKIKKLEKETEKKMSSNEKINEKKFKLFSCYKPRHVSNYFKALKIDQTEQNVDYCLLRLNSYFNLDEEIKLTKLVKEQLIDLKNKYDIRFDLDIEKNNVYCIYSCNKSLTIDMIKDRIYRLLDLDGKLIKSLIEPTFKIIQQIIPNTSTKLSSNFLMDDISDQYVRVIKENIYLKFLKENKRKILIYGPTGIGKTIFGSMFGRYFCRQEPNEQNICLSFQMGSKADIYENYFESMLVRLEIKDTKDLKNKILMINDRLSKCSYKNILFIFDDVKNDLDRGDDSCFKLIKQIIMNLPEKVYILFLSRADDSLFNKNFEYTQKMKEFDEDKARKLFEKCLSHKGGKIDSILDKLNEMKQSGQIYNTENFIPSKLKNIISFLDINQNRYKTIDEAIKSINIKDMDIYDDLFKELINNEENKDAVFMIQVLALIHRNKITFSFLSKIKSDPILIEIVLQKLRNNSILIQNKEENEIFFSIQDEIQTELINYLENNNLKENVANQLLESVYNYYEKENFINVMHYELNHCLIALKHGKNSGKIGSCFTLFKDSINNLAKSFRNAGKYEEAIKYYDKLVDMEIIRDKKDEKELYKIYLNLEKCHTEIGNSNEASNYQKELEKIKNNGEISDDDMCMDSRDEGEDPYEGILNQLDHIKEKQKIAETYFYNGFNLKRMKKFYEACNFFEQSFNIYVNEVYINGSHDQKTVTNIIINLKDCYDKFKISKQIAGYEEKLEELNDRKNQNEKLKFLYEDYVNSLDKEEVKSIACIIS